MLTSLPLLLTTYITDSGNDSEQNGWDSIISEYVSSLTYFFEKEDKLVFMFFCFDKVEKTSGMHFLVFKNLD